MRYSKIKLNDSVNGVGISISLFTQGCPHHCRGCFNKNTWDYNGGELFTNKERDLILNSLDKYGVDRNLSILGGEPLCPQNIDGVIELCRFMKKNRPQTRIYIWTGYLLDNLNNKQKEILSYADILVDGKFEEDKKDLSLKLRGSSNQRVIDIKKTLEKKMIILADI